MLNLFRKTSLLKSITLGLILVLSTLSLISCSSNEKLDSLYDELYTYERNIKAAAIKNNQVPMRVSEIFKIVDNDDSDFDELSTYKSELQDILDTLIADNKNVVEKYYNEIVEMHSFSSRILDETTNSGVISCINSAYDFYKDGDYKAAMSNLNDAKSRIEYAKSKN